MLDNFRTRLSVIETLYQQGLKSSAFEGVHGLLAESATDPQKLSVIAPVLWAWGYRSAALSALKQADALKPKQSSVRSLMAQYHYALREFEQALALYTELAQQPAVHPEVWLGLGRVKHQAGFWAEARALWQKAFSESALLTRPDDTPESTIRVLVLADPAALNTPVETFLSATQFSCLYWHVRYWPGVTINTESEVVAGFESDPSQARPGALERVGSIEPLPQHDVVFNALSDVALFEDEFSSLMGLVRTLSDRPIINDARGILASQRARLADTLQGIKRLITARVQRVSRDDLLTDTGSDRVDLIRPIGTHTGEHFYRCATTSERIEIVKNTPFAEWYVMPFIETRSADGWYRKYRMVCINGQWYPLHLAVSQDWKVHYFSAESQKAEWIAEQTRFLEHPDEVVGGYSEVFAEMAERVGLSYFGVDFGFAANGDLVVFEANATMYLGDGREPGAKGLQAARLNAVMAEMVSQLAGRGECS